MEAQGQQQGHGRQQQGDGSGMRETHIKPYRLTLRLTKAYKATGLSPTRLCARRGRAVLSPQSGSHGGLGTLIPARKIQKCQKSIKTLSQKWSEIMLAPFWLHLGTLWLHVGTFLDSFWPQTPERAQRTPKGNPKEGERRPQGSPRVAKGRPKVAKRSPRGACQKRMPKKEPKRS